mmetsp:Transcript_73989/g.128394  ORF Transcript_73989/g.128394 Transcript_73989/m.128394 type:complete len:548 (+) Transcript_73989:157-1800(+)
MVPKTKTHTTASLAGSISSLGALEKQENISSDEATRAGSVISDSEDASEESPSSSASDIDAPSKADLATPVTDDGSPKIPVLCIYNARGRCTNEHKCRFAHGDKELAQVVASISEDRSKAKKTKLCRFFTIGRCLSGPNCLFAHGDDELRGGTAQAAAVLEQVKAAAADLSQVAEGQRAKQHSKAKVASVCSDPPACNSGKARPVTAWQIGKSPWVTQSKSKETEAEADAAKWAVWKIPAPPTTPPRVQTRPPQSSPPPKASAPSVAPPPTQPVAAPTVPPIAPPRVSPLELLQKAKEVGTRSDSDDEQHSSNLSTKASFTEETSSETCSEEQVQNEIADDHLIPEQTMEQASTDSSLPEPEPPLEVVKVERWDEDLGRWVVDFIEIEPLPSTCPEIDVQVDSFEAPELQKEQLQASPSSENARSRVCLQDLVQAIGVPRIASDVEVEAERCSSNASESQSSVSKSRTQLGKLPWYRTPLRSSAARFVPEAKSSSLRSAAVSFVPDSGGISLRASAAMFVPDVPTSRLGKAKSQRMPQGFQAVRWIL